MIEDPSFRRVRDEISRDLAPVHPLRGASFAALAVVPLALVLLAWLLLRYGLRADAPAIGFLPLWGPAAVMVAAAYAITYLGLAQRMPESAVSWIWWVIVPLAAAGLQVGGGLVTLSASGGDPAGVPWSVEAMCFLRISLMGIAPLLFALWLLSRGLPLQPRIAGLLAGLGGGFLAEGIYRLFCSLSSPAHIIPWHSGAVLGMGALGMAAGFWWDGRAARRFVERRA